MAMGRNPRALKATDFPNSNITVTVIGTGYVGLTVGACFAYLGHRVRCTDVCPSRVEHLRAGVVPIVEAGLDHLVGIMLEAGRLSFSTNNVAAVQGADFVVLCLPTPQGADGSADLSRVRSVAREIGAHLKPAAVVVNKSTVPVGTASLVEVDLQRDDVTVVSNPEFLAEGSAVADFLNPDRVIVGGEDAMAARSVADLYAPLNATIIITDVASAETIKYASNAYMAIRLSFVNSMAAICEASGADIRCVTAGMGADHRIGTAFLKPGPGWGGSCFPKDTAALVRTAEDHGFDFGLLRAAVDANSQHRRWLLSKVVTAAGGTVEGKRLAFWGVTFKAGTDDLRDSPALELARDLVALGATVQAYDPTLTADVVDIVATASPVDACRGCDVLVIGTEWPIFASTDLAAVAAVMATSVMVDCRNVIDADLARDLGFEYDGLGFARSARVATHVTMQDS